MSRFGRTPVVQCDRGQPRTHFIVDDEERTEKRPQGMSSRFVDRDGNVLPLQLASDGDPHRIEAAERKRREYHRKGFVEHAKCPVKHGTMTVAGKIADDFAKMPDELRMAPCDRDPRVMHRVGSELHAGKACPHIEWLIEYRRARYEASVQRRNAGRIAADEHSRLKREREAVELEFIREQLEERRSKRKGKGE